MSATDSIPLSDDLLTGAAAIAAYIGPPWNERKIYYIADRGYLPIGRVGTTLVARKSQLSEALSGAAKKTAETV